jgi:hypothetical protein
MHLTPVRPTFFAMWSFGFLLVTPPLQSGEGADWFSWYEPFERFLQALLRLVKNR